MSGYQGSKVSDDKQNWPKPKQNRHAGKGMGVAGEPAPAFAGKGKRAMPFKATGHKGGISFR